MHVTPLTNSQQDIIVLFKDIFNSVQHDLCLNSDSSITITIMKVDEIRVHNRAELIILYITPDGVIFDAEITYQTGLNSTEKTKCNIEVYFDEDNYPDHIKVDNVQINGWHSLKYS